jgi:tripartite-type tricarboxylate transporter receptor subunit TctC
MNTFNPGGAVIGKTIRRCFKIFGGLLAAALAFQAAAQTFPTKPIRIVVPYSVGSAVDLVPRLLAERMSIDLGQSVIVENRSGGQGLLAINAVLSQPADGYCILVADAAHWGVTPAMQRVNYDFMRDFAPLSQTYTSGQLIFVSTASGITSLQDLITKAKANPGKFNYASPGIGSIHFLSMEVLKSSLGLDIKHIPYRGSPEVAESVLRGDAEIGISSLNGILPQVKAGKFRLLAVNIGTRLKQIPDVPTVAEVTGLKDFEYGGQQGMLVRAGTPKYIIDKLSAAIQKAALAPDIQAKVLDVAASDMTPTTPAQFSELIRSDIKKYAHAVKVSGVKVDQ